MIPNFTFDTGALIAWERNRLSITKVVALATEEERRIYVPEVVVAEWWRGPTSAARRFFEQSLSIPLQLHKQRPRGRYWLSLVILLAGPLSLSTLS